MSLQYYDSDNEALIPIAGNVNPSDVIELKATKADKTQISNPNLLDNPWFTVNQRGQSSYSNTYFTVDRWRMNMTFTVNVTENGLTISNGDSSAHNFYSLYEFDRFKRLLGKVVTLSMKLSDGTILSGTIQLPSTAPATIEKVPVYESGNYDFGFYIVADGDCQIYTRIQSGDTLAIRAMKLELGSQSTLAMDTIPNYALELIKCQRYYYRINNKEGSSNIWRCLGLAHFRPSGFAELVLQHPVTMRVSPIINVSGVSNMIVAGSSDVSITSIVNNSSQTNNIALDVYTATAPASTNDVVEIWLTANGESTIELSADL